MMWGDLLASPCKVLQPPRTSPPNTEAMPAMVQRKTPDHPSQTRDLRLGGRADVEGRERGCWQDWEALLESQDPALVEEVPSETSMLYSAPT